MLEETLQTTIVGCYLRLTRHLVGEMVEVDRASACHADDHKK